MEGNRMKFELRKEPVFREKVESQIEVSKTTYSEERDIEPHMNGEKGFSLINEDRQEVIGNIHYECTKNSSGTILKVRFSGLEEGYRGQSLGLQLYEHLIELAKDKGLDGIGSDSAVQAGGIVVWKKLIDKGYKVLVNPQVENKWKSFNETYNEGKLFKEILTVNSTDSVFKILFKDQE